MVNDIIPEYEIRIGAADVLEDQYTYILKGMLSPHGSIIDYKKDSAAIDFGLHLYQDGDSDGKRLFSQRVWMQCKSIQTKSIDADTLQKTGYVPVKGLSLDHIAYWYSAPEPVYLVVYIASLERYLLEDVRVLVDSQIGAAKFRELMKTHRTTTLRIETSSTVDHALKKMMRHRSMRIDYPLFRGKALGHGLDPLRTTFRKPDPKVFTNIVQDLLQVYDFRASGEPIALDGVIDAHDGELSAFKGTLYSTYEWTSPFLTEYGHDGISDFREESQLFHAHGNVVVIVHSLVGTTPSFLPEFDNLVEEWKVEGIEHVLVFFNDNEGSAPRNIGLWKSKLSNLCPIPQGFESLSYNILTALPLYTKYFSTLTPRVVNVLQEAHDDS